MDRKPLGKKTIETPRQRRAARKQVLSWHLLRNVRDPFGLLKERENRKVQSPNHSRNLPLVQEFKDMIQPPDEILQHGAFPCALAADHRDLRQIQVATLADGAEGVLELVDEGNEVFHSPVSHDGSLVSPAGSTLLFWAVK